MVDQETFSRRLAALAAYLGRLKAFLPVPEDEFLREAAVHDLAERYLHLAVEAAVGVANHYIATSGLRVPDTNADSFRVLEEAGELPPDLAAKWRGWAGFRNVLVHEYVRIDHAMSYRAIQHELPDLERLIAWAEQKL